MGMGAMKPGSTVPPQGGKGGVQQPGQPPYRPIGLPPSQPTQVPAQGGKGPITLPRGVGDVFPTPQVSPPQGGFPQPGQVPPQGGKGRDFGPYIFPGPQQPGQVPAQGGKAPLTPEQQAQLGPYINPVRPMPQVQQPAPLGLNLGNMLYGGGQQPTGYPQRDLGYGNQLPQGMPRPMPQVMPRQPTPKPAPQGLGGLAGLNGVPGNQNPRYFGPGRR